MKTKWDLYFFGVNQITQIIAVSVNGDFPIKI